MSVPEDPQTRTTTQQREAAVTRLQNAFIHGQLDDRELAIRIDGALDARTVGDLNHVLADIPVTVVPVKTSAPSKKLKVRAFKGHLRRTWEGPIPARGRINLYKSSLVYDLRGADWTRAETQLTLKAYKSAVVILVPSGVRVEHEGASYQGSWVDHRPPAGDGPVLVIRGSVYKGSVVISETSPED